MLGCVWGGVMAHQQCIEVQSHLQLLPGGGSYPHPDGCRATLK